MKNIILLFAFSIFFVSCDTNKYTKVTIQNKNDYPIAVKIVTANIESVYEVEPLTTQDTLRNFSDIDKVDGQWEVTITNMHTNESKEYKHGKFYVGDLANFFKVINHGKAVGFSVDN